jgi:hypothetical protein
MITATLRVLGTPFRVLGAAFRALLTPEGRRAWALILLAGSAISMTGYASVVLWLVRHDPSRAFYLGVGAMIHIAIVTTGLAGLLVKRDLALDAGPIRLKVSDQEAQVIADKVVAAIPPPPPAQPSSVIVQTGSPPAA